MCTTANTQRRVLTRSTESVVSRARRFISLPEVELIHYTEEAPTGLFFTRRRCAPGAITSGKSLILAENKPSPVGRLVKQSLSDWPVTQPRPAYVTVARS